MNTYQAGDEIKINGVTAVITGRRGFRAGAPVKFGWYCPGLDLASEVTYATVEAAVASLYSYGDTRCGTCGEPATLTASTGPACQRHYDDMAG